MFGFIWRFWNWIQWGICVGFPGWFVNIFQVVITNAINIAASLDPLRLFGINHDTFQSVVIGLITMTLIITLIYNFLLHGDGIKMREMTLGQLIMRLFESVFIGVFGTLAISIFMTILNPVNLVNENNINNVIQNVMHPNAVHIKEDSTKSSIINNNKSSLVNSVLLANDSSWQLDNNNKWIKQHNWQISKEDYQNLSNIEKITLSDVIHSYSDDNYVYKLCGVEKGKTNDCVNKIKDPNKGYNSPAVGGGLSTSNDWYERFFPVSLALDSQMEKGTPDSQEGKYFSYQINGFWVFIQLLIIAILLGLICFKTIVNVLELMIWKLFLPLIAFDRLTRDSRYLRAAWAQIIELILSIFITIMLLNSQSSVLNQIGQIIDGTEVGKNPFLGTLMKSIMQLGYVFLIYSGSKITAVFGGNAGSTMNGKSALNGLMQATNTAGNVWNGLKNGGGAVKRTGQAIKNKFDGTNDMEGFEKSQSKINKNKAKIESNLSSKEKIDEKLNKLKENEKSINPNFDENKLPKNMEKLNKLSKTYDKANDKLINENSKLENPKTTLEKVFDGIKKGSDTINNYRDEPSQTEFSSKFDKDNKKGE